MGTATYWWLRHFASSRRIAPSTGFTNTSAAPSIPSCPPADTTATMPKNFGRHRSRKRNSRSSRTRGAGTRCGIFRSSLGGTQGRRAGDQVLGFFEAHVLGRQHHVGCREVLDRQLLPGRLHPAQQAAEAVMEALVIARSERRHQVGVVLVQLGLV